MYDFFINMGKNFEMTAKRFNLHCSRHAFLKRCRDNLDGYKARKSPTRRSPNVNEGPKK